MRLKLLAVTLLFPVMIFGQTYQSHVLLKDRLSIQLSEGVLHVLPLNSNAVRIQWVKDSMIERREIVFTEKSPLPVFRLEKTASKLKIKMHSITVEFDKQTSTFNFSDRTGKIFLSEKVGSRKLVRDSVMGEPCFVAEQSFASPSDEYLFGLGQFQDGHYNIKGVTRRLIQVNSQISIPFIYSNKGYGLLWHQYGLTDYNPADNKIPLEKQQQSSAGGNQMAEVTTTSGTQKVSQNQSLYTGTFTVPQDGEYSLFLDLGDMGNRYYVIIDGTPCIDQSNMWLPPSVSALVKLKVGEHHVQVICKSNNTPTLSWKLKENCTTFRSPNAKALDYVVFYGPSADEAIASYRNLSGNVPMFPKWAFGFWQCRERYTSGTHLVETVKEFRKRNFPMDVIVQDWQYWGNRGWGVPQFDTVNYSNPAGFINELHNLHSHFNISIWSNPDKNSTLGKGFVAQNLFIPDTKWLDYFNPETRNEYWKTLKNNLFTYGVDSWWMDAVEPENDALKDVKTYLGLGDFYRLTYPLFVSQAVYEGQRKASLDKRVCILTRSAFLGQQRYGIVNWSGDIGSTWDTYRRQIVAGLNYSITGLPYWTTDIGGFFRPGNSQYTDKKYQELLTRWYQWGAFNPIFRIHGYQTETEPWHYGQQVEENMRTMLTLRYRLLPYIYSNAWQVTKYGSTMMRPLIMDFRNDTAALSQRFEYMFGNNILVAPITEPNITNCNVYLPKNSDWYDFWNGNRLNGGQTISTDAPLNIIPLFIKAGSIIPMGPAIQYATEKNDPIEIRIYPGADGKFVLYEDQNDNYNYEKGLYSTITFRWDDTKKIITINGRKGSFPGMLNERTFNIVLVNATIGTGVDVTDKIEKIVKYNGTEKKLTFR